MPSVLVARKCKGSFFKYLKTYAFYPQKGIYFLKGNKILYKIVVLCFTELKMFEQILTRSLQLKSPQAFIKNVHHWNPH